MAPPIETIVKSSDSHCAPHPPLNERILSSMTRRSVAAHPWHDLEIAWARQAQVVSYLCKQKADVGVSAMDGMGAIHFATQKGHLEVV
ncbi:hypothetical protein ES288_D03G127200v1 [Gossypium darwinii]|uniref:Uncharacterized protein n=1 Tax=Gossypium darwinii TaxID=34276 RepID=A0A5D2D5C9_GOSDA|nr:hypothetical protein ES288_D03G127200v1 [Gossypium darwinii]